MPYISVIIPTYNRGDLIKETIESVLNQTYKNFEIIVVDDGSTDNTKEVIENIKDSRIKYIYQKNAGTSAAKNNGIQRASGKYIAFVDSDDLWMPKKLEKQIEYMKKNPEIGICGTGLVFFGENFRQQLNRFSKLNDIKVALLFNCALNQSTVVIKNEILTNYNLLFDTSLVSSEDYDLFVKISKHTKLYNIPEVYVKYRVHASQLSEESKEKLNYNANQIRIKLLNELGINPTENEVKIHQALATLNNELTPEFFSDLNIWIKKLINANLTSKIYDISSMYHVICHYWLSLFAISGNKSLALWYFIKSPLPLILKITAFIHRVGFFALKRINKR